MVTCICVSIHQLLHGCTNSKKGKKKKKKKKTAIGRKSGVFMTVLLVMNSEVVDRINIRPYPVDASWCDTFTALRGRCKLVSVCLLLSKDLNIPNIWSIVDCAIIHGSIRKESGFSLSNCVLHTHIYYKFPTI